MSKRIITVRGHTYAVEAKAGTQLKHIIAREESKPDELLHKYADEYSREVSDAEYAASLRDARG